MKDTFAVTFCGGVEMVTGSNFLIEAADKKYLVDCGLIQGHNSVEDLNREPFPYNPKEIDVLFVTHAHVDHVGRIPLLVSRGFQGEIYSTPETKVLAGLMLEDVLKVFVAQGKEPLFSKNDIEKAFSLWKTVPLGGKVAIDNGEVKFYSAGHILGAAMVEIVWGGKSVLFTGDIGNTHPILIPPAQEHLSPEYIVMESVYGDRTHETPEESLRRFTEILKRTIDKKGVLLIPAFSLERTQLLLYELNSLIEKGVIPSIPVYLDSPLGIAVTEVYTSALQAMNKTVQKESRTDDVFSFPKLTFTKTQPESLSIDNVEPPKIIIAGSGMSEGGRVMRHEKRYLEDKKNTILFVGYQVPGSLGRHIKEGSREVFIEGEMVKVRADVEVLTGYSGHRDSESLLEFAEDISKKAKKVFVVMGEPRSSLFLAQRIRDFLGINAIAPRRGERFELS